MPNILSDFLFAIVFMIFRPIHCFQILINIFGENYGIGTDFLQNNKRDKRKLR